MNNCLMCNRPTTVNYCRSCKKIVTQLTPKKPMRNYIHPSLTGNATEEDIKQIDDMFKPLDNKFKCSCGNLKDERARNCSSCSRTMSQLRF